MCNSFRLCSRVFVCFVRSFRTGKPSSYIYFRQIYFASHLHQPYIEMKAIFSGIGIEKHWVQVLEIWSDSDEQFGGICIFKLAKKFESNTVALFTELVVSMRYLQQVFFFFFFLQ